VSGSSEASSPFLSPRALLKAAPLTFFSFLRGKLVSFPWRSGEKRLVVSKNTFLEEERESHPLLSSTLVLFVLFSLPFYEAGLEAVVEPPIWPANLFIELIKRFP